LVLLKLTPAAEQLASNRRPFLISGVENGMARDFDLIVIGSGAGGGTFAFACALAGKSVLLLERGARFAPRSHTHDERAMLIEKKPYEDRPIVVNGAAARLYLGGVYGGGTALYGAALLRPSRDDFHPGRSYGKTIPREIWDWPISYEDLEPFYAQAEGLYGVAGCRGDDYAPLQRPALTYPEKANPAQAINRKLIAANRSRGLRPFRLPLAIDFRKCLRCGVCPGYICPNGARRSSAQLLDGAIESGLPLKIMTGVEAEIFTRDGKGQVDGVQVLHRATGTREILRSQRYGIAAGALASPLILLRSGFDAPLIGRNYMYHLAPIVAGIFSRGTGAESTFVKEVGFADYYLGSRGYAHKMGLIQSLPVPGPLMMTRAAGKRVPHAAIQFLRKRMLPLLGIVEDLPNPENRVNLGAHGQPSIHHSFCAYDLERGRRLCRFMIQILKAAGALFCLPTVLPSTEHVSHQCGTLRFGRDPATSIAGADCRMFGQARLFVIDGSIFPTSLGVGPALTIMANALRVARIVTQEI
jgi:choline dehydrogenase-like flavoprotein